MFAILKSFLPPDPKVQDTLDAQVASVVLTGSGGMLANVGIISGFISAPFSSRRFRRRSVAHGIHADRNWWSSDIISFFLLFWFESRSCSLLTSPFLAKRLPASGSEFSVEGALQEWVSVLNLPLTGIALIILALVLYLLTPENYLTIRQALPGAIFLRLAGLS
jgi:uncharacterized BrkB/YihY/UPF0761 family membrane protein